MSDNKVLDLNSYRKNQADQSAIQESIEDKLINDPQEEFSEEEIKVLEQIARSEAFKQLIEAANVLGLGNSIAVVGNLESGADLGGLVLFPNEENRQSEDLSWVLQESSENEEIATVSFMEIGYVN